MIGYKTSLKQGFALGDVPHTGQHRLVEQGLRDGYGIQWMGSESKKSRATKAATGKAPQYGQQTAKPHRT